MCQEDEETSELVSAWVFECTITSAAMNGGDWAEVSLTILSPSTCEECISAEWQITVHLPYCLCHMRHAPPSSARMAVRDPSECISVCLCVCVHVMKASDPCDNSNQTFDRRKLAYIVAEIYFRDRAQGNVFTKLIAPVFLYTRMHACTHTNTHAILSVKMPFGKVEGWTQQSIRKEIVLQDSGFIISVLSYSSFHVNTSAEWYFFFDIQIGIHLAILAEKSRPVQGVKVSETLSISCCKH